MNWMVRADLPTPVHAKDTCVSRTVDGRYLRVSRVAIALLLHANGARTRREQERARVRLTTTTDDDEFIFSDLDQEGISKHVIDLQVTPHKLSLYDGWMDECRPGQQRAEGARTRGKYRVSNGNLIASSMNNTHRRHGCCCILQLESVSRWPFACQSIAQLQGWSALKRARLGEPAGGGGEARYNGRERWRGVGVLCILHSC